MTPGGVLMTVVNLNDSAVIDAVSNPAIPLTLGPDGNFYGAATGSSSGRTGSPISSARSRRAARRSFWDVATSTPAIISSAARFSLKLHGSDAGAGVQHYDVYVSEEGSAFQVVPKGADASGASKTVKLKLEAGPTFMVGTASVAKIKIKL